MNKMPNWIKIVFSVFVLIFLIILYAEIKEAAELIVGFGAEMSGLRSQSGNSVAEHYYQLHGYIYALFGRIIEILSWIIPVIGIVISFVITYPIFKENRDNIKNKVKIIRNNTQQFVQAVSQESVSTDGIEQPKTTIQPQVAEKPKEKLFCEKCGSELSREMDFCTHCGNKISK